MSKVFTKSGFKAAPEANKIFALSDSAKEMFNRLWIWPAKAISGGKRTANTGDIYVGERSEGSADCTPDVLTTGDLAYLIELPVGETKALRDVIFQADNAADGVYFKYW